MHQRALRTASGIAAAYLFLSALAAHRGLVAPPGWRWLVVVDLVVIAASCTWIAAGAPLGGRTLTVRDLVQGLGVVAVVSLAVARASGIGG